MERSIWSTIVKFKDLLTNSKNSRRKSTNTCIFKDEIANSFYSLVYKFYFCNRVNQIFSPSRWSNDFFLVQKRAKAQEENYKTKRTFRGMQAPDLSSKRIFWSSLGGVSITWKSKAFKVKLKLANQSAALLLSRQVWFIWTCQFMFLNSRMRRINVGALPLILQFLVIMSTNW
jgi:hypothetical protein